MQGLPKPVFIIINLLPEVFFYPLIALLPALSPALSNPPVPAPPPPTQLCGHDNSANLGVGRQGAELKELIGRARESGAAKHLPSGRCGASSHSWLGNTGSLSDGLSGVLVDLPAEQICGAGSRQGGDRWCRGSCRRRMMEKWIALDPGITEPSAAPPSLPPQPPSPLLLISVWSNGLIVRRTVGAALIQCATTTRSF